MHPRPNAFPRPSLCNLSSCRPLVLATILLLFGLPSGGCSPEPALEDEEPQAWVDLALDSGDPAYLENELGILCTDSVDDSLPISARRTGVGLKFLL